MAFLFFLNFFQKLQSLCDYDNESYFYYNYCQQSMTNQILCSFKCLPQYDQVGESENRNGILTCNTHSACQSHCYKKHLENRLVGYRNYRAYCIYNDNGIKTLIDYRKNENFSTSHFCEFRTADYPNLKVLNMPQTANIYKAGTITVQCKKGFFDTGLEKKKINCKSDQDIFNVKGCTHSCLKYSIPHSKYIGTNSNSKSIPINQAYTIECDEGYFAKDSDKKTQLNLNCIDYDTFDSVNYKDFKNLCIIPLCQIPTIIGYSKYVIPKENIEDGFFINGSSLGNLDGFSWSYSSEKSTKQVICQTKEESVEIQLYPIDCVFPEIKYNGNSVTIEFTDYEGVMFTNKGVMFTKKRDEFKGFYNAKVPKGYKINGQNSIKLFCEYKNRVSLPSVVFLEITKESLPKIIEEKQGEEDDDKNNNKNDNKIKIIIGVSFSVTFVIAVSIAIIICKCKKILCFKKNDE